MSILKVICVRVRNLFVNRSSSDKMAGLLIINVSRKCGKKKAYKCLTEINSKRQRSHQRIVVLLKRPNILTRRNRNQRGLDKRLTPERNRLLLISIQLIRTTVISLPTLFRGREIACSKTKRLRCCCRADQSCRQIKDDLAPSLKRPYTLLILWPFGAQYFF